MALLLFQATLYQADINDMTCSGVQIIGDIGVCYNTSWAYYSLDGCTAGSSASTSPSSSGSSASLGGTIAGAIVGSVCGLGIIAATCVYLFWYRPGQKRKEKQKELESEMGATRTTAAGAAGGQHEDAMFRKEQLNASELNSPADTCELASTAVVEAPADVTVHELHPESYPIELPGNHEYLNNGSERSSIDAWHNRHGLA